MTIEGETKAAACAHGEQQVIANAARRRYVLGNTIASVAEVGVGLATGNVAQLVDGMHGMTEISVGNQQLKDAQHANNVKHETRRGQYGIIFGASVVGLVVSVRDAIIQDDIGLNNTALETVGFGASMASFCLAAATSAHLARGVRKKYGSSIFKKSTLGQLTTGELDSKKHIIDLDLPVSTVAFASGSLRTIGNYGSIKYAGQEVIETLDSCVTALGCLWAAKTFRPSKANLYHDHSH